MVYEEAGRVGSKEEEGTNANHESPELTERKATDEIQDLVTAETLGVAGDVLP